MIRHFFLDKTNTIIEGSRFNYGLNPILSLGYGHGKMRGLIHFDIKEIRELIKDKTFANTEKLKFFLKMTNCFSVAGVPYEKELIRGVNEMGERACSCDVILFKLPCDFDAGRGFDFVKDFWVKNNTSLSKDGSTWYCSKSMIPWSETYINDYDFRTDQGGIYSKEKLEEEYTKYKNNEKSIIVGEQHFDFGNENLNIDITNYVLECIETNVNNGLCLSFTPYYEKQKTDKMQCLDFFNDNTNTYFHPYVEVIYNEYINDNRINFTLSNNERLYLYVYNDGVLSNLDKIPTCTIEDKEYIVKQASKGTYYIEISYKNSQMMEESVYYDKWSNIVLNGEIYDDIEMEFYVNKKDRKISIGNKSSVKNNVVPSLSGINDGENLNQGEIREITVDFREKFSTDKKHLINTGEYRLYVKDDVNEIDVINYHPIEICNTENYFLIHTMDLIPNEYYVDIKINSGREVMIFKNVLRFKIVNNVTERYQ